MNVAQYTVLFGVCLIYCGQALECPKGFEQFGSTDEDISTTAVATEVDSTISGCAELCASTGNCVVFSFDDNDECKLFDTVSSVTTTTATQILCTGLSCPEGSPQIGAINNDFTCTSGSCDALTTLHSISECQDACDISADCVSFSWAPYRADSGPFTNECTLWSQMVPDTFTTGNQIICQDSCNTYDRGTGTAFCVGDPHFKMWNGLWHHFQGQVSPIDYYSYYMVTACNQNARTDLMPWSIVGIVYGNGNNVAWDVYMVLELYNNDDIFYVFIDSAYVRRGWVKVPFGTSRIWEDVIADTSLDMNGLNVGNNVIVEDKFQLLIGGDFWHTLSVYTDGTDTPCTVNFKQQSTVIEVNPPSCYTCYMCGLFGDFQAEAQGRYSLLDCHGQRVDIDGNWYPSGAWALRQDGVTWQTDYVDDYCQAADVPPPVLPPVLPPAVGPVTCSDVTEALRTEAETACQSARTAESECCMHIAEGRSFCAEMQALCEDDSCAEGSTEIPVASFNEFIEAECGRADTSGSVPKLLYEFEGDLSDTMSGGDPAYDLEIVGTGVDLDNGMLSCDGNDFVVSKSGVPFGVASHTFEALVQFGTLDGATGGSFMGIEDADGDKNEMIAFDRRTNGKVRYGVQSEFFMEDSTTQVYERKAERSEANQMELQHIVVTFLETSTGGEIVYYRDGVVEDLVQGRATSVEAQFVTAPSNFKLSLCRSYDTSEFNSFDGNILFAAYYENVLSEADVETLYQSRMPTSMSGEYENMGNELMPGKKLRLFQALFSVNGGYALYIRKSGSASNLVLVRLSDHTVIKTWATATNDADYLMYGEDGKLALYNSANAVIEEIYAGEGSHHVVLTSEGDFKVYNTYETSTTIDMAHTGPVQHLEWWNDALDVGQPPKQQPLEVEGSFVDYMKVLLVVLLSLNAVCLAVTVCRKNAAGTGYKVVSIDSTDVETDIEDNI